MTVRSTWNGSLAAGASTSFGFTVNGGSTPPGLLTGPPRVVRKAAGAGHISVPP
ncbi:hypothetical protein ACIQCD_00280 [Streptomyces sp. NPDC093250]|uniref:hypothetical protein n=1 Tax=Streptomyces sp. NPDC093250 TaxID=3366036 RepID=UPI00381A4343